MLLLRILLIVLTLSFVPIRARAAGAAKTLPLQLADTATRNWPS